MLRELIEAAAAGGSRYRRRASLRRWLPLLLATMVPLTAFATSPAQDRQALRALFQQRFPKVPLNEYVNGPYPFDAASRAQWESLLQLPPYVFEVERGRKLFSSALGDGGHYADCFVHRGVGIRQNYPYFDRASGEVVTLELAINRCRRRHGSAPLAYEKGDLAAISAYLAETSRGKHLAIAIPPDPRAIAAYRRGRALFYAPLGDSAESCATCHIQRGGQHLGDKVIPPALGLVASFPLYRPKWSGLGTFDRRLAECYAALGVAPPAPQSRAARDLEYFLSYLSDGLPVAGPGVRL